MTSTWLNDLKGMTESRKTAQGIVAEMMVLDIQARLKLEIYYTKLGPYLMMIEVEGKEFTINQVSPFTCVQRANDFYGDNWKEISFEKQTEFMERIK